MGKLFIVLDENVSTIIPKRGENKGKEYSRTEYTVLTADSNNYILAKYEITDSNENAVEHEGKYYSQINGSSKYYGSPEHAINSHINKTIAEPSEDITNAYQLCKKLNEAYLTKKQFLDTWLPIIKEQRVVEKKLMDY